MKTKLINRDMVNSLLIFVVCSISLALISRLFPSDFYLISLMFLFVAITILGGNYFDNNIKEILRLSFFILGVVFFILSMLGLLLTEKNFSLDVYIILYGAFEIVLNLFRIAEAIIMIKEKNYLGIAFIIGDLAEMTLGILLIVEEEADMRLHLNLISFAILYEGIMKFINEIVERKKGIIHDKEHHS